MKIEISFLSTALLERSEVLVHFRKNLCVDLIENHSEFILFCFLFLPICAATAHHGWPQTDNL